jgi:hypothetical protein
MDIYTVMLPLSIFLKQKTSRVYTLQFLFNLTPAHYWTASLETAHALCAKPLMLSLVILPQISLITLPTR